MLLTEDFDISFDGIDIIDALDQMGSFFSNLSNLAPSFQRIGLILNRFWGLFPSSYWFALIIVITCLTIGRVICRRH